MNLCWGESLGTVSCWNRPKLNSYITGCCGLFTLVLWRHPGGPSTAGMLDPSGIFPLYSYRGQERQNKLSTTSDFHISQYLAIPVTLTAIPAKLTGLQGYYKIIYESAWAEKNKRGIFFFFWNQLKLKCVILVASPASHSEYLFGGIIWKKYKYKSFSFCFHAENGIINSYLSVAQVSSCSGNTDQAHNTTAAFTLKTRSYTKASYVIAVSTTPVNLK